MIWTRSHLSRWSGTVRLSIGVIGAVLGLVALHGGTALGQSVQRATDAKQQSQTQRAPRRVVLRFVTEGDFPPFNFYDEDGVLTGFNIDLARAVCVELNTACDINVREWKALLTTLTSGQADAAIAGHAVDAHALLKVDFSDRYFHTPGRFAGRRDSGELDASIDGLEGKRIGVASGTAHEAFVRQFFLGSRINVYDDADKARAALINSQIDVIFDDAISLAFWLKGTLSNQCCKFVGGAFMEPKFFGDGIAIAISRRDPVLKQEINEALKRVRASGRFDELVTRYFPFRLY